MNIPDFKSTAKDIITAQQAQIDLEFKLEKYLFDKTDSLEDDDYPYILNIGCDNYDESLEIYVVIRPEWDIEAFCKLKITQEFMNAVLSSGCSRFWINFYYTEDKSNDLKIAEIYCGPSGYQLNFKKKHVNQTIKAPKCCGKGCCQND
jgi:hypothetical protein